MTGLTGNLANILASIVGSNKVPDDELRQRSDVATPTGTDANGLESFQVSRPQEGQVQQAQPQAQSSPAEPKGSSFDAKQLLELLPIFAASAELFNPFAKGGGPVSLGSKIGDAIGSGLDTQKSISSIKALEAKTKSLGKGKTKFQRKTADEFVDGKRMSVTRLFDPSSGESEVVRMIPSTSALRPVTAADAEGNLTGGVVDLDQALKNGAKAFTPLFDKGEKGALTAAQKQQNLVDRQSTQNLISDAESMITLATDNPTVVGAAGKVRRGVEIARGAFDSQFIGKAQDFNLSRLRLTAGITPKILSETRGISNEERKLVEAIILGGDLFDTPGISIKAAQAGLKVLKERDDLLGGIITVRSNAEANALPVGTKFRLPNGRQGVR